MFSPVLLITVAVVLVSAKSINEASHEETERIIGGKTASPGQYPWAVALYYNDQFICTASILSKKTVLTAAHCVVFNGVAQSAENFYAIANVSKSAGSVRIDFANVTPHPDYNEQSIDNDVAVFETAAEILFSEEVGTIYLAGPDTPMTEYKKATVMGWGATRRNKIMPGIPDKLQYTEQKIVDNSMCSWINPGVNEDKICSIGLLTGVCNGDSGGPLVAMSKDKKPVQIGITSYINSLIGCGSIAPAVFTRVSAQYDFIMQAANDDSIGTV